MPYTCQPFLLDVNQPSSAQVVELQMYGLMQDERCTLYADQKAAFNILFEQQADVFRTVGRPPTSFVIRNPCVQTLAPDHRFETLVVHLFGPLPKTENTSRWV